VIGRLLLVAICCAIAAPPARAAKAPDPVLARCGNTVLTESDLRELLATLPPDTRETVTHSREALAELLRSAVLQSVLYARAHDSHFDRDPEVAAAAERARQGAIVSAYVAHQVSQPAAPGDAVLRPLYDANKPRLMQPRQFHLAQIFIVVPASATPDEVEADRRRLIALRATLAGKPDAFAAAARKLSDDARSASQGGDLGWIAEDKLAPPIKDAVGGLPVGSLSDPVRMADGWHLISLISTKPAGPMPFDQARPLLARAYAEQEARKATQAYLDSVLKQMPIELDSTALQTVAGGS
jgi:parvulin-like peptidyl-prolyl isomerase